MKDDDDSSSVPDSSSTHSLPGGGSPATASTLTSSNSNSNSNSLTTQPPEQPERQPEQQREPKRSRLEQQQEEMEMVLQYPAPQDIPWPSRGLIETLFHEAVQEECPSGDQRYLRDAGLLSLEQVLLPAVAYCEERALKQLQAKTQRDRPALKSCVVRARKAVYGAAGAACAAVRANRAVRAEQTAEREAQWRAQAEARARRALAQAEREREAARQRRRRELQMNLPANRSLWLEEAYLMTQLGKLKLEEQQWIDSEAELVRQEAALQAQEEQQQQQQQAEQTAKAEPPIDDPTAAAAAPPEVRRIAEQARDIGLSARRIENALAVVAATVEETEQVRQALYRQYCRDHQFHGYPSVDDARGLLSALSQQESQSQQPLSLSQQQQQSAGENSPMEPTASD